MMNDYLFKKQIIIAYNEKVKMSKSSLKLAIIYLLNNCSLRIKFIYISYIGIRHMNKNPIDIINFIY